MKITITKLENGKVAIESPYNPDFVAKIKKAGGKWDPSKQTWNIDERSMDIAKSIMREVYGQDDLLQETVTVKVTVGERGISEDCGPIVLFGRIVASARGRDGGAKVGNGVSFEKGGADSGGSRKNWYTWIADGSSFAIYDVPRLAVEQKIGWDEKYGTFEVVENGNKRAALEAEKEALLKRLAEIDELLKEA